MKEITDAQAVQKRACKAQKRKINHCLLDNLELEKWVNFL